MNPDIWIPIGVILPICMVALTILYERTVKNSKRIGSLELDIAHLKDIPAIIEKHEKREDKQFGEIKAELGKLNTTMTQLAIDVGVIKRNGVKSHV